MPCVASGLPALSEFYRRRANDRFEIIAFHDATVASFSELDEKIRDKKIRERCWGGRPLPFPVFLDATGKTLATYEIRSFPTSLLFDPQGRFVGEVNGVEGLKEALSRKPARGR